MCLTISRDQAFIQLATEDIFVYKIAIELNGQYISYYEKYHYDKDGEMRARYFFDTVDAINRFCEMETDENSAMDLSYGFHSFVTLEDARKFLRIEMDAIAAGRYYRSFSIKPTLVLLKFMISPGTQLVRGTFNLGTTEKYENILSEKFRFVEVVE
jgi:hypothetical protein